MKEKKEKKKSATITAERNLRKNESKKKENKKNGNGTPRSEKNLARDKLMQEVYQEEKKILRAKDDKRLKERRKEEKKNKEGKPAFPYSRGLGAEIALAIASSTKKIEDICQENPHFPCFSVIYKWIYLYPEFEQMYDKAKSMQARLLAAEIIEIADDSSRDWTTDKDGFEVLDNEHVQRSKIRLDARKWIATKLLPRIYGDRTQNDTTVTIKPEDALKDLK